MRRHIGLRRCAVALTIVKMASPLVVIGAASASAAGPDVICCGNFFTVTITANATNFTINYTGAFSGEPTPTFYWGNVSSGEVYSQQAPYNLGTLRGSVFIDFIEPSTTYEFTLSAGGGDCIHGGVEYYCYYESSFSTKSDSFFGFSGFVSNVGKSVDQSGGVYVEATCATIGQGESPVAVWSVTNAAGHYDITSIPAVTEYGVSYPCYSGPFAITVQNSPTTYFLSGGYHTSNQWNGYWNETIVTFAEQPVNFVLDSVAEAPANSPVVTSAEFTHTPDANVSYCSGSSQTTTFESSASVSGTLFGLGFSVDSSVISQKSLGNSGCVYEQTTPGYEIWGEPDVSGSVVFNGVTGRALSIPWEQYYGDLNNNGNAGAGNATGAPLQDWLAEPTQSTDSDVCHMGGITWFDWPIPAHTQEQVFNMWVSGSISSLTSETWGVTEGISVRGVEVGTASFSADYSLTTTTSSTFSVGATFEPSSVEHYYTIACTGGSAGQSTGIVMHIWEDS